MSHVERVGQPEVALAKRQVIYAVQDVRLAGSIGPYEAVYPGGQIQIRHRYVPVIYYVQSVKCHLVANVGEALVAMSMRMANVAIIPNLSQ